MTDTCANGFENLNVELVSVSHDEPFRMFWNWYRETWRELHGVEYDPDNQEHLDACIGVLNGGALPTPKEVLTFEVRITGLSRVALAQITRGRVGHCYNVQSQMPQTVEHAVTVPRNISEHHDFGPRVRALQEQVRKLYDDMYDAGIPPQDCRYITLHGQQTTLVWNVSYAALVGWYTMRCENGLTDELNLVGRMLRRALIQRFCVRSPDGRSWCDEDHGSGWTKLIGKLDCLGASQGKCLNVDKVFGNTGRFPSGHAGVPDAVAGTCSYRFDNSAFYLELLNMDETLLLPGEKEMIDDWRKMGFLARLVKVNNSR